VVLKRNTCEGQRQLALTLYLSLSFSADDFSTHGCPFRQSPPSSHTDRLRQGSEEGLTSLAILGTQCLARTYGKSSSGGYHDGLGLGFLYGRRCRSHCGSYLLGCNRIRVNGGLVVHASFSRFFTGDLFKLLLGGRSSNFPS
jgi:hypothetical protein